MDQIIQSTQNKLYMEVRELLAKKMRYQNQKFLVEGFRVVKEAIESNLLEKIIVNASFIGGKKFGQINFTGIDFHVFSDNLFSKITDTQNSQGIIAVCKMPIFETVNTSSKIILLCDQISDPGNLGTIIRTCDAFNVDTILLTPQTVDPYSPKVVRATMGSIFRTKIHQNFTYTQIQSLTQDQNIDLITTSLGKESENLYRFQLRKQSILAIGSEARGVSTEILKLANHIIKIPINPSVESLNASISTGIILSCLRNT